MKQEINNIPNKKSINRQEDRTLEKYLNYVNYLIILLIVQLPINIKT